MKAKQIVFTKKNTAELLEVSVPELKPNDVLVKVCVTTISTGTERANITDSENLNTLGIKTGFPRYLGYNAAGIVEKTGSAVKSVKPGDRVMVYWSQHVSLLNVPEERVLKIDDEISFETAALSFIASFPMSALRKTRLEIGEGALVMGLGLLGMIGVKLFHAAGAVPVIAADINPERRSMALKNGADYALDPSEEGFAEKVKELTGGGVNAAIEVTGVGAGFDEALDCMARFGRIALLGCTRNSDFTVDYYKKIHGPGITVVGAHTNARPNVESSAGLFTHRDDIGAILKLCKAGRIELANIITETHSPSECEEVYNRLVFEKNFPLGVQFDWRLLK